MWHCGSVAAILEVSVDPVQTELGPFGRSGTGVSRLDHGELMILFPSCLFG